MPPSESIDPESEISTPTFPTSSTLPPLDGQVPSSVDSPDLQLTSYEGWSYKLKMNLAGLDLKFNKVISDSPPGLARLSLELTTPSTFPGLVSSNPSGNPGRNIPVPNAEVFVVVNGISMSELTMDYGRAFIGTPCQIYTGDGLPDFVPSDSPRLFCGPVGLEGALPISGSQTAGTTEEVSEVDIDDFLSRSESSQIDIWVYVAGCLIVFSKGKLPFTLGNPWNGPNQCSIESL